MKRIAIVTSTRADWGLLSPIVRRLREYETDTFRTELLATGTHLSPDYGMTIQEIINEKTRIDARIPISTANRCAVDISNNQAQALTRFTEVFEEKRYSAVILLGDRYEILAVAMAACNTRTPIIHISGGDVTEGAMDDCIRHAITKMSFLHLATNEESRRRIIRMGEAPERVFCVGSTSIDNVISTANMTREEAMDSIGLQNEQYALCTYHPVTLEDEDPDEKIGHLLAAFRHFSDMDFVVTKSNADRGGERINQLLDEAEHHIPNLHVFASLGARRYLSLMKYAQFVMGNSSSGIVETPAFHIPTVNIGNRQRGRLQAESIINCGTGTEDIIRAAEKAMDSEFRKQCAKVTSPYGDGHAAERVAQIVMKALEKPMDLMKTFYDGTAKV